MFVRVSRLVRDISKEVWLAACRVADIRSFGRIVTDLFVLRLYRAAGWTFSNKERQVHFRNGATIVYRMNPGDIWSLREVWLLECYRLPAGSFPKTIVDLGANVGMTSIWLAKTYDAGWVTAVEPSRSNSAIVRKNFHINEVRGQVMDGAAGPLDGVGYFQESQASNTGTLGQNGAEVQVFAMATIMASLPARRADLVKIDIEGGEQELFMADIDWLENVDTIVAEFHPSVVDYRTLVSRISGKGLTRMKTEASMDFFTRL